MKALFRILASVAVALSIMACGSSGPPSSWDDMALVYAADKDMYRFLEIETENSRPFSFGDFIATLKLKDKHKPTWDKDEHNNWTLTSVKFIKKENRQYQSALRFFHRKIDNGTMDAVVLSGIKVDGEALPPLAIAMLVKEVGEKYIKQKTPK